MDFSLNYGKSGLYINIPDTWEVNLIEKKTMPVMPNVELVLEDAFNHPIGSESLYQLARLARSACIVICDITRPVPNGLILPSLVQTLLDGGLTASNIKILVATGLHRPNLGPELEEIVGSEDILKNIEVINHFARNESEHVNLGFTARGTPVNIDRRLIEADLKIAIGLVEPHFMAGYSGGRKVIVPGVAKADTITRLHTAAFLEHPNAANCVLEGNPLHEEQIEIMSMIGDVYAVNVVITDKREISFINFGEVKKSHLEAVAFIRQFAEVQIEERYSTVITSAAGYPLDTTYYQTVKGMVGAMDALKPGGRLFIVSSCANGMGSPEYIDAQERFVALGLDGFLNSIRNKTHAAIDEWQTEMQLKSLRIGSVCLYTEGLDKADALRTGVEVTDSLMDAVFNWVQTIGDTKIAVIPEGPYVIPVFSKK
jgi:lactate racemase